MKGVTTYSGLSQFYFRRLLKQIVKVGQLERQGVTVLDFGCGRGELKRMLGAVKVVGYDIISELSDVPDWRATDFNEMVANQVFYSFSKDALDSLLQELKQKKPALELVVGISRQGLLNKIGKLLLGRANAFASAKMSAEEELVVLKRHCDVIKQHSIMSLADVYLLRLKK